MNARDRHPNALGVRDSRPQRSTPPPQRRKSAKPSTPPTPPTQHRQSAKPSTPTLTSPRVTAVQASDSEAQRNPLYGAPTDLFIY